MWDWVEFVGSLLCSERFFSGYSGFNPASRASLKLTVLQANCEVNSSRLLETLKWDQLSLRKRNHKAIFKSLNWLAPVYLHELFSERYTDYDFRDFFRKLNLPKPRTNYLKRSFSYSALLERMKHVVPNNVASVWPGLYTISAESFLFRRVKKGSASRVSGFPLFSKTYL